MQQSTRLGTVRVASGTTLAIVGLALMALYLYTWWSSEYREAPSGADSPLPISVTEQAPIPFLIELVQPSPSPEVETPEGEAEELEELTANEPTLPLSLGPAERLVIPRIGVDSAVVSVGISRGEWPVPKFMVGHLAESVYPGDPGNSVYAGHLTSIASGNVFARLKELDPGDELTFFGKEGARAFRVVETRLVKNTDVSVLASRPGQALVTLITCEGRWIPRENDYDQRRVVFAEPIV